MNLDKKSLRVKCLAAREGISRQETGSAAMALADYLLEALPISATVVAFYRPIRAEIDPAGALSELITRGHTLCLPVAVAPGEPLVFRRWQPGDKLEKDRHGVEVPVAKAPVLMPDAVVVPLLAFDAQGYRLGYGAGYYDQTIRRLRESKKNVCIIGAAFAAQQVESLPAEAHDEKLDMVVTEQKIIRFA